VAELSEILDKHKARLLALPGCTGVAIGYKEVKGEVIDQLAIIVFVKRKQNNVAADHLVPQALDGTPTDVIEKTFGFTLTATDPFARFPQLIGGLSITPHDAAPVWGSLGCVIHTTGNAHVPHAGDYLLSNHHVLTYADPANPNSTTRAVIQPGKADEPPPANYSCGDYVWGQTTQTSDCAITTIGAGRTWRNQVPNHPLRPGNRTLRGIAVAAVGDEVYKYGATTKSTRGVVRFTNYTPHLLPIQNSIYVENADGTMWVAKGDSGSVLIRYSDDFVVGLNFAADETTMLAHHPTLPNDLPAYSAGYAYDIQSQMNLFGGVVRLA